MGKSNKLTTGAGRLVRLEESRSTETDLKISAGRLGRSELKLLEYTGKKKTPPTRVAPPPYFGSFVRLGDTNYESRPLPSRFVQELRESRNDPKPTRSSTRRVGNAPEPTRSSTRRVGSWQMAKSFQDKWVLKNKIMDLYNDTDPVD